MAFRYVAYNAEGQRLEGRLDAAGILEAEEALFRDQLTVVSLTRERRLPSRHELLPSLFGVRTRDLINFSRQLATLLDSGISLMAALRALSSAIGNDHLRRAIHRMIQDIATGDSFSAAAARQPAVFPALFVSLVKVGEGTGRIELMLNKVADYLEKQSALASRIRQALTYPSFVLAVGLVAAYVVFNYSLPAMINLFREYQAELPATTRLLIAVGDFMGRWGWLLAAAIVATVLLIVVLSRSVRGKLLRDRCLLWLPLAGDLIRKQGLSRIAGTLSVLLGSGMPFPEAMELTTRATGNAFFRTNLAAVRDRVLAGQRLSQALSGQTAFTELFVRMVAVGEEGGKLEANLTAVGRLYEEETERAITRLTSMIEPAIVILIGGGVGFVAVAVLGSVYGILQQIR